MQHIYFVSIIEHYHTSYFCCQYQCHTNLFLIIHFVMILLLENWYSHGMLRNIQQTLRAIYGAFPCIAHLSIYSLSLMLSDQKKCHWLSMTTSEHAWLCMNAFEWVLNTVKWDRMQLSALGWAWMCLSAPWTQLNTIECTWIPSRSQTQLNALCYWFLHATECTWMPMSECECTSVRLSTCECLWVSIEWVEHDSVGIEYSWMELNALECTSMTLSEHWTFVNVHPLLM